MRVQFQKDLICSGFIHRPLPLYTEGALEKAWENRVVQRSEAVWNKDTILLPFHDGEGAITFENDENGDRIFSLNGDTVTYCWPEAMSPDGDCSFYGTVHSKFCINAKNWEQYHCLTFWIKPECDGSRIVNVTLGVKNEGTIQVPDEYYREGSHVVNLINHQWNECIWEFGSMARDKITELEFSCRLSGRDTSTGENVCFHIKDVYLETVAEPEPDKGWNCKSKGIAYSTSGYFIIGDKTAVTAIQAEKFQIIEELSNKVIYEGKTQRKEFQGEEYSILDFSSLTTEGIYRLQINTTVTKPFPINEEVYEEALWKVINFLYCERCGYPVPEKHGLCHRDVVARHQGKILSFCGGWHDAGDMSQQLIHTAEVTQALMEMAEVVKQRMGKRSDTDKQLDAEKRSDTEKQSDAEKRSDIELDWSKLLYERLIEEAVWGLEFIIKSRFGDGYRATSAGLVRWTNGIIGDEDDVEVRSHNHAFENLLCSGICAVAAKLLQESDRELAWRCLQIAKEDYAFGMDRFKKEGMELPIMWEHTYSSSKSQYYALITWTSSVLYERTKDVTYADTAVEYVAFLLQCQETKGISKGLKGFFYRDEQRKAIVHYSHQSREYMFIQAFELLCTTQSGHKDKGDWENAMLLYGTYLKNLMQYASPYQMVPAGVYNEEETEDKETFQLLHLLVDYDEQKDHYKKQLQQGISIDHGYYIKNFPVWFSFRGNSAIHLAMGTASAVVGGYFKDNELIQMAKEQLYWISGKNPFHQSMIYGEGDRYAQQYAVMPGEMPVGIQTNEDEDVPYWPHNNNATYKEVWTSSACRWLWTLSAIYRAGERNGGDV